MASYQTQPDTEDRPIDVLLAPFLRFIRIEASGGILLLICTIAALIWANSAYADSYAHFWHLYIGLIFDKQPHELSLAHFVNDGLMAIFFFVVGLEIKREFLAGELASMRKAAVPIAAAAGGMIFPALVYVALNRNGPGIDGWAIPMATDIAFAVGIMALLGSRISLGLKVFVTALAIVDDLGAVLIIALFYTAEIHTLELGLAGGLLVISALSNRLGVRSPLVYTIIGLGIWTMLLRSGVHATVGGVLLALTIPSRMRIRGGHFVGFARDSIDRFEAAGGAGDDILTSPERQGIVGGLESACEHVQTPLNRLERSLHPWVAFVIMPVFALANAGVTISGEITETLRSPIALGVALGLLLGKPVGIVLATWIAVKCGVGDLPARTTWRQIFGAGLLAGIGFTMSLFIGNLGFGGPGEAELLLQAKIGILTGSIVAGVLGFALLRTGSADAPSSH